MGELRVEELRREVMDRIAGMAFGPFPAAGGMMVEAQNASPERLVEMAQELLIDVNKYM